MSFQQGLSGLNAASKNLDVIGHNIANSNTVGFKASRAEFAEMVAFAIGSAGGSGAGIGVETANVAQQLYAPAEVQAMAPRLLLHASHLAFAHPSNGEPLALEWAADF